MKKDKAIRHEARAYLQDLVTSNRYVSPGMLRQAEEEQLRIAEREQIANAAYRAVEREEYTKRPGEIVGLIDQMGQSRTFTREEVLTVLKASKSMRDKSPSKDPWNDGYDHGVDATYKDLARIFERME